MINASSFRIKASADALADTLRNAGYTVIVSAAEVDGTTWHRVRAVGFSGRKQADEAAVAIGALVGRENLWVSNN